MEEVLKELEQLKGYALLSAKEMLTIDDVSLLTGMKPSYIRKLAHEKKLPYYKPFGKELYFHKAEINGVLMDRRNRIPSISEIVNQKQ